MQQLFLTSRFDRVKGRFIEHFPNAGSMRVAFISTASDVYEDPYWVEEDRQALKELGIQPQEYDIKSKTEQELYDHLVDKEAIFVAGGNVFYLTYHARRSGFDHVLARLLNEGKLYIGSSAGSALLGPTLEPLVTLDDPGMAPELIDHKGLGLVDFVVLPHYGAEKYEERYQDILRNWSNRVKLQLLRNEEAILITGSNVELL